MSNQVTTAMFKIACFLNVRHSLPFIMIDQTIQQVDPIEQREAIQLQQANLDREKNQLSYEIAKLQSRFQTVHDSLDELLAKRDSMEDEVEDLYMKLYRCVHAADIGSNSSVIQEEYRDSNEVYEQLCHQKSELEHQLVQIDEEVERMDIAKSNLSENIERLLDKDLDLIRRRDNLEENMKTFILASNVQ
ncbi:hypothetical protein PS15m_001536 [Mucor circinelloides]